MADADHPFAIATVRVGEIPSFPMLVNVHDAFIGPMLLECGHWELVESTLLARIIQPRWCVIDVGANVGYYSLLAAFRVGPDGEVWAFEPEPANFRLLAANVALNGCTQIALMQAAVGACRQTMPLRIAPTNLGDHRLALGPMPADARMSIDVEVVSLDDCVPDYDVHVVKIDTQGTELEVLAGMRRLIARNRDRLLLLIELSPGLLADAGRSVDDYATTLTALGARVFTVRRDGDALHITAERSVTEACTRLTAELVATGVHDASTDLFVCFSEAAVRLHFCDLGRAR